MPELAASRSRSPRSRPHWVPRGAKAAWSVGDCAIYGQEVELPEDGKRPAQRVSRGLARSPGSADDADVIEMGGHSPRWPWRSARGPTIGLALAALCAGLVLGFVGGHLQASTKGRPALTVAQALTAAPQVGSTAITMTGSRCAVQLGRTLQLGIEIVNQSGGAVAWRQVRPVLPLGGMRPVASQWGTCGLLPIPAAEQGASLDAHATEWLTITFDVIVQCPEPLPVEFKLSYMQSGRLATAKFLGFPDLGQVRYNNCPTNQY